MLPTSWAKGCITYSDAGWEIGRPFAGVLETSAKGLHVGKKGKRKLLVRSNQNDGASGLV